MGDLEVEGDVKVSFEEEIPFCLALILKGWTRTVLDVAFIFMPDIRVQLMRKCSGMNGTKFLSRIYGLRLEVRHMTLMKMAIRKVAFTSIMVFHTMKILDTQL